MLRALGHRIGFEIVRDLAEVERALVDRQLQVERNQAHQRDERAEAEVKRDLKRRVVLAVAAAPDADHDERRHQRQFVEEIEEKQVERRERAENAAGHHQQQDVKLLFAFLDFPRNAGGGEGDERAHQNQADVNAIHAQRAFDAERLGAKQRNGRDELIGFCVRGKAPEQRNAQQRDQKGRPQCHQAHDEPKIDRDEHQADCGQQREGNDESQGCHSTST